MAKKRYKSQKNHTVVEVTPKARAALDMVNEHTGIPRRRLVEVALLDHLARTYADVLR